MAYADLAALKEYLGIDASTTTNDQLLENLLERVTARIETHCGRRFDAVTDTRYYESDALDTASHTLYVDDDLLDVSTLTNGDDDSTEIPDTEYWLVDRNAGPPYYGIRLKVDSDYTWEWDTDGWVSVEATWGWCSDPPDDIVQACIEWAAYAYRQKDTQSPLDVTVVPDAGIITIPKGIPGQVLEALEPYRRKV